MILGAVLGCEGHTAHRIHKAWKVAPVGRHPASPTLKRVGLEHGVHCPLVVLPDTDVGLAAHVCDRELGPVGLYTYLKTKHVRVHVEREL